jgi:hypothetical protein
MVDRYNNNCISKSSVRSIVSMFLLALDNDFFFRAFSLQNDGLLVVLNNMDQNIYVSTTDGGTIGPATNTYTMMVEPDGGLRIRNQFNTIMFSIGGGMVGCPTPAPTPQPTPAPPTPNPTPNPTPPLPTPMVY